MSANTVKIQEGNWKSEVLESDQPVLVDFWAEWCAPCRAVAPVLEELGNEMTGNLKIGKVNVDESPSLASEFGIRAIPTMVLFKQGKEASRITGALSKAQLKSKLEPLLKEG